MKKLFVLAGISLFLLATNLGMINQNNLGQEAAIFVTNCYSSANGHEWVVTLEGYTISQPPFLDTPQSGWVCYWYTNYGGSWYNFNTTYGTNNSTSLDGLWGTPAQVYVVITWEGDTYTSGTVNVPTCDH
ncbi:MAG: hypothetical protein HY089_03715 [Ignavibacteriales bacterium]|nr:hypothetical protein [Ignavibacteriales bacterium]